MTALPDRDLLVTRGRMLLKVFGDAMDWRVQLNLGVALDTVDHAPAWVGYGTPKLDRFQILADSIEIAEHNLTEKGLL